MTTNAPILSLASDWLTSCDFCASQEEGRHYCLLHGIPVTDMNITTCPDWTAKEDTDNDE